MSKADDNTVLQVNDLNVSFDTPDGRVDAVRGVNLHINRGECLGIVGESGSGKSQTFMTAMGLLANNGIATGDVLFHGKSILGMPVQQLNKIRGKYMTMIFQDPLTSLTPHMTVLDQMTEVLKLHTDVRGEDAARKSLEWLERVRISDAKQRLEQYPHELSGGMRQRVMIAMSMLCEPELLIADEPTTALDVTVQAEILDLMDELKKDSNTAIALITHDMGVVARMCDRIQVMKDGVYVEEGTADDIFYSPQHDYTKMLLDAMPRIDQPDKATNRKLKEYDEKGRDQEFLTVDDVRVEFDIKINEGWWPKRVPLKAVDGVTFTLRPGETLGIVGESGCGKSTLARAVLQLIPPTAGAVSWLGSPLSGLNRKELNKKRKDLQIVFQDPLASLDPRMTIADSIMEPLQTFRPDMSRKEMKAKVAKIMERVGLPQHMINRYPHELSGGQNQRVGIARAMIMEPKLVVCDEAVSALDVSIQAQIIELLMDLQEDFDLSLLFISHDLSVVREVSHRIMVLYLGRIVELADRHEIYKDPRHPYTKQLISAVPIPDPKLERSRKRIKLPGELPSPMDPTAKLRFMPSKIEANQLDYVPRLDEVKPGHYVAEHDELEKLIV
ncbi:ABC transporter ATP-binding protein [Maritalea myrionectae]|uniref:Oligopeptide transport ATP-binding protein OppD n=1 Tax=Maritalea myrionectae TaxID=454601 RepID=A0A2R4MBF3_9HYPH|nr:ABC transporter ATP-binding protein [Maritalea myrionectae]AVX03275.1 oligopeptide transport ATP-binding protein OppD [Maritalea myrionectae]